MSVNLEWDVAMQIVAPWEPWDGTTTRTVDINTPFAGDSSGNLWLYQILDPTSYSIVPGKFRPTIDSLSQADGSSIQPPLIDGMVATIEVAFQECIGGSVENQVPACDAVLREMNELLMGQLNSLRTYPPDVSKQQYLWLPTGTGVQRLLDGVILASWPTPDFRNNPEVRLKFQLGCPYPYALDDDPQTTDSITPGEGITLTNGGNSPGLPIMFLPGPSDYVSVTNLQNGLTITYNSTLPGAQSVPSGHTLQFDFHEGSVLLDGDPDQDYIAGLDPTASSFWPLVPGGNLVENNAMSDADVYFVFYNYWI